MSDIGTIFRRLNLKQAGQINYIDFFNAVYGRVTLNDPEDAAKEEKAQKLKKKFITLIDKEQEDVNTQKEAQRQIGNMLNQIECKYKRSKSAKGAKRVPKIKN